MWPTHHMFTKMHQRCTKFPNVASQKSRLILTYQLTYLPTYLPIYLPTFLPTYLPTDLPTYPPMMGQIRAIDFVKIKCCGMNKSKLVDGYVLKTQKTSTSYPMQVSPVRILFINQDIRHYAKLTNIMMLVF